MLIETDIILAHIKESNWLKPYASVILEAATRGAIKLYASRELIHELYYVASRLGMSLTTILERIIALSKLNGIEWIPTTLEVDLTALTLMSEYGLTSIFDAYHAATALLYDPDKIIISTDRVYDRVPGLTRMDPQELAKKLESKL